MGQYRCTVLKPLVKPRVKHLQYSVFDIEGRDWSQFLVAGHYNGDEYHHFFSMDELIDHCFTDYQATGIGTVWAHFGGIYDFMFLIHEVLENKKYKISEMLPRGSGFLLIKVVQVKTGVEIVFRDSSAVLPFGLAKLTESFGVEHKKQKFDVSNIEGVTPELLDYLKDDCRGLYEVLEAYQNWDLIKKVGVQSTMASQAMKVFRLYLHRDLYALSDRQDRNIRAGYFGGRTEIFKPFYKGTENLYCYDVNSLYPTVMRDNEFPNKLEREVDYYTEDDMGFFDCTVEVPKMYIPPLPYVMPKVNKLVFPTGTFRGMWSNLELSYAQSLGVKIKRVHKGYLFSNGGYIFRDYIDDLYRRRLEAIEKGDGVGNIICKLLMNSCYGRFGLNKDREEIVFDDMSSGLKFKTEIKLKDGSSVYLMSKPKRLDSSFANVAISSWVTAASRVHMHKKFGEAGFENIYYTDTDSLFTTTEMETGSGLGELKEEYRAKRAIFLLPKTYFVEGFDFKKVAMKGFSNRKIQHFSFEDFEAALEGDLRAMKVTHDEKLATFMTAIRRFDTALAKLPKSEKAIRSKYDKREIFKSGQTFDSKALHVDLAI